MDIFILWIKCKGRTGRILARGLDSTDLAQRGLYKKDIGPIFSQCSPEQPWSIRDYYTTEESIEGFSQIPCNIIRKMYRIKRTRFWGLSICTFYGTKPLQSSHVRLRFLDCIAWLLWWNEIFEFLTVTVASAFSYMVTILVTYWSRSYSVFPPLELVHHYSSCFWKFLIQGWNKCFSKSASILQSYDDIFKRFRPRPPS